MTLERLGSFCARRPWWVIGGWILVLLLVTVGHRVVDSTYQDDFTLPGSQAQTGADLLTAHLPAAAGVAGQVVFTDTDPLSAQKTVIESAVASIDKLDNVASVSDPFAAGSVSKDGQTAYATVQYQVRPDSDDVDAMDGAVAPVRAAGVKVAYGGALGVAARPSANDLGSELAGLLIAILVLLLGFGSVIAAGLPIASAVVGVGVGMGVLGMVAGLTTFASASPTLGLMMGLGVGIDYALFLTTRHRQHLIEGLEPDAAIRLSLSTSGRSVLVAALTVVLALLGLYASGIGFVGKLGLAAAITVSIAAVAGLTLVPAFLGLAGRKIDRWHVREPVAEAGRAGAESGWHRYALRVERHPWLHLGAGLIFLFVLAAPALSMRLGHVDAGADPASDTSRKAYDAIAAGFGPGANGPLTVVIKAPSDTSATTSLETALSQSLATVPGVASVSPPTTSPDKALVVVTVVPDSGPQDAATETVLDQLRDTTLPGVTDQPTYITGTTAAQLEFRDMVASRLPLIVAVVLCGAFVLLMMAFRSPILALKAAVLNLVSIGAAFGVIVAVFQWGWGASLIGVSEKVPIEAYVPMMMFAIIFGLSMDYEVFLLSRVREVWLATGNNADSVAGGLSSTARVISCAALIMASVFLSFAFTPAVVIKMLAIGLGVSVLIDATVVRLLVVPATMFLLGHWNWWMPAWLDRILPRLEPEEHH